MSARDDLRDELLDDHGYCVNCGEDSADCECGYEEFIDAAIGAGYRKPRTITELDELEDLGRNTAILSADGVVWVNDGDKVAPWASVVEDPQGGPIWVDDLDIKLPATVLHEGATK